MSARHLWRQVRQQLYAEGRQLITIRPSDRPWQMPFAAALASGLPLLVGAAFGRVDYGLVSSLGGLVFLYLPDTPLHHRMVSLMASAFAMIACYTLGIISHLLPAGMLLALATVAMLSNMTCRFYQVNPPGSLFFFMAAAIGAYSPVELLQAPFKVGLLALGCLLACVVAFVYSLFILSRRLPRPVQPLPPASFEFVVFDSVLIGVCVGVSLLLAQALQLHNPYWVPVSCLAVIQGMSLRAVWEKQLQRLLGTSIGLLLSWGLLALPLDPWRLALMIIVLTFIVETAVVRHYGFAAIFITPLTLLLAEAVTLGHGSVSALIQARFVDTLLGCLVGLVGGVCLHSPRFRAWASPPLRRLLTPQRPRQAAN
jgi:uncharacterized membrane protein YccC